MDEKDIIQIEKELDYEFKNKALLKQAFTRSSFSNESKELNSEVLEFIGDRVIEYHVTKILFDQIMSNDSQGLKSVFNPGELTFLKSLIVENENLASIIHKLGFEHYIRLSPNEQIQKSYRGDLLESVVGSIAIDSNFNQIKLYELVNNLLFHRTQINYKGFASFLYVKRWCKVKKHNKLTYSFKLLDNKGSGFYRATIKFGNYEIEGISDTKVDALLQTASLAHEKIIENKEEIAIKDFLIGLNENNGKEMLHKLKIGELVQKIMFKEERTTDNKWKITLHIDRVSTCYIDTNKRRANKICSLLGINSLLTSSNNIDPLIGGLLIKLGYQE